MTPRSNPNLKNYMSVISKSNKELLKIEKQSKKLEKKAKAEQRLINEAIKNAGGVTRKRTRVARKKMGGCGCGCSAM